MLYLRGMGGCDEALSGFGRWDLELVSCGVGVVCKSSIVMSGDRSGVTLVFRGAKKMLK